LEIEPFSSEDKFLTTSPELYMKRLLAAGYDKIFQFSHCFRKGEIGRYHNPEFILLEWYRTDVDYLKMIEDTEQLIVSIARGLGTAEVIQYKNQAIDITPPWEQIAIREAFLQFAGWDPVIEFHAAKFDLDLVTKVIPCLDSNHPAVLVDYPAALGSLARLKPDNRAVAERAEVFVGGLELANAYSELTDISEQRRRFLEESRKIALEKKRIVPMPVKFLESLQNLPDCGGIALGMDRLVMLFCDALSIDDVIAFPDDNL
jgi:lysyl-tRNA synthetase class 2